MTTEDKQSEAGLAPADWTRKEMKGIPASLGAVWTKREGDEWCYGVQLDKSHANAHGVIHGGVMMTFIDHVMSVMIWNASGRGLCSTVHLDSHFLSALRPPVFVEFEGKITKQGRKLVFARGMLKADGKEIMEASGVWSVAPLPESKPKA